MTFNNGFMSKNDQLTAALDELRREPGVCVATLARVDQVLKKLAGQRLTLKKGSKRQRRLEQASALIPKGATQPEAILVVCRALGCSRSTGWRLVRDLRQSASGPAGIYFQK